MANLDEELDSLRKTVGEIRTNTSNIRESLEANSSMMTIVPGSLQELLDVLSSDPGLVIKGFSNRIRGLLMSAPSDQR